MQRMSRSDVARLKMLGKLHRKKLEAEEARAKVRKRRKKA
jgi:hypothetical protein